MIAPFLASSLVIRFKPENKSQLRLIKDLNSTKMNDFLIHGILPVILYSNMLNFRGSNKSWKLDGDPLKVMTNFKFNEDHSNPPGLKNNSEFAEEMNFVTKNTGRPSTRGRSVVRFLNTPAIMSSGISTIILSSDTDELCIRLQ